MNVGEIFSILNPSHSFEMIQAIDSNSKKYKNPKIEQKCSFLLVEKKEREWEQKRREREREPRMESKEPPLIDLGCEVWELDSW